jgi:hypothetical protein
VPARDQDGDLCSHGTELPPVRSVSAHTRVEGTLIIAADKAATSLPPHPAVRRPAGDGRQSGLLAAGEEYDLRFCARNGNSRKLSA